MIRIDNFYFNIKSWRDWQIDINSANKTAKNAILEYDFQMSLILSDLMNRSNPISELEAHQDSSLSRFSAQVQKQSKAGKLRPVTASTNPCICYIFSHSTKPFHANYVAYPYRIPSRVPYTLQEHCSIIHSQRTPAHRRNLTTARLSVKLSIVSR